MATSKSNTVEDIFGDVLKLEADRLIEDHKNQAENTWDGDWAAKYSDIRAAVAAYDPKLGDENKIIIRETKVFSNGRHVYTSYTMKSHFEMPTGVLRSTATGRIGCRVFSAHNFRKILKAAGVQSVRKAKAARAGA
jgi:hypothetical protein